MNGDNEFIIKELEADKLQEYLKKYKDEVFENDHSYVLWDILDKKELDSVNELKEKMVRPYYLRLGAFDKKGNFLGWSFGFQENSTTFYMCNSGVLEKYRRKGIYSLLLRNCLERLNKLGFQEIYSKHNATNNAVLIPKLKEGFVITKFELSDIFGVLVHLTYFTNRTRKKVLDYRCGQLKPDLELKEIFKI